MLLWKYMIKTYFIFPPHLTTASALPGEMKRQNSVLSLKCRRPTAALQFFNQSLA